MKKKLITMWIFNILMWVCLVSAIISGIFSRTAYWILMGCWLAFAIANIITCIVISRSIKREEQQILKDWDEKWKQQLADIDNSSGIKE